KEIGTDLVRERPQLLDRRGPVDVAGDEKRFLPFLHEHFRELRGGGRLARALQAGQQNDRGRRHREIERGAFSAHERGQLAVHYAHQRLARGEAAGDARSQRRLAHAFDEGFHHGKRHVRLEERNAHFALRTWLVYDMLWAQSELHFGFGQALSVMLWLAVLIYWIESRFLELEGMQAPILALASVCAPLPALFPGLAGAPYTHSTEF